MWSRPEVGAGELIQTMIIIPCTAAQYSLWNSKTCKYPDILLCHRGWKSQSRPYFWAKPQSIDELLNKREKVV